LAVPAAGVAATAAGVAATAAARHRSNPMTDKVFDQDTLGQLHTF
jgi:hypothetical protein